MNIIEKYLPLVIAYGTIMKEIDQMCKEYSFRLPRKIKKKFKKWLVHNSTFTYCDHDYHKYYKPRL